jgi:cytochrome c peroxidase
MKKQPLIIFTVSAAVIIFLWLQHPSRSSTISQFSEPVVVLSNEPIDPLPRSIQLDERKVSLGEQLFNDPILSHNNTIACVSCHSLNKGGSDQLPKSVGMNNQQGERNAPTVLNAGYNFRQFWDGRAETLEEQVDGPISNPQEMASNWTEALAKLNQSRRYVDEFSKLYPTGLQAENVRDAIATYERSLITPDSRFDRYLRGESEVLTEQEKSGYQLFKEYGCASCHQGTNIGGNLFEKFGVMDDEDRAHSKTDLGRFNVTGLEKDKYVFKVPSLRNVELTAPYFHDGSAPTLDDAVKTMSKIQLGRSLPASDATNIVQFLKTLTGVSRR